MPNPFAANRRRSGVETQSDLDLLNRRLLLLGGLTGAKADEFRASWGVDDPTSLHEVVRLDDDTLRRMIAVDGGTDPDVQPELGFPNSGPSEVVVGVLGGDEPTPEPADHDASALLVEAADVVRRGTVAAVVDWAAGDDQRARLALIAERVQAGREQRSPRKTLVNRLESLRRAATR